MSWTETGPALLNVVAGIDGIGPAYLGDLHLRDEARVRQLFMVPGDSDPEHELVRGARVAREAVEEVWWSTERTMARERYVVRLVDGLRGMGSSEADFQRLIDRVMTTLRAYTSLGSAHIVSRPVVGAIAYTDFAGFTVHSAEVALEVEELYTVGSVTQLAHQSGSASARSSYPDVADQIAVYLAGASPGWNVHALRPFGVDEADRQRLFERPLEDEPDRVNVRSWTIYRASDAERDGLGRRVETDTEWRLEGSLSWHDATGSYDAMQRTIDTVRATFRGVNGFGHVENFTLSDSQPLQVTEIGARMLMDTVLVHFADCRLPVAGVVHA